MPRRKPTTIRWVWQLRVSCSRLFERLRTGAATRPANPLVISPGCAPATRLQHLMRLEFDEAQAGHAVAGAAAGERAQGRFASREALLLRGGRGLAALMRLDRSLNDRARPLFLQGDDWKVGILGDERRIGQRIGPEQDESV